MSEEPNLDSLFEAAILIDAPEMRAKFVREACGDDHKLRRELQQLLNADEVDDSFLNNAAAGLQQTIIPEPSQKSWAASLDAGLALSFDDEAAVVLGDANHSVLRSLENTLNDVPRVALRDPQTEGADPISRPNSPELPKSDSDSRYRLDGEIARGGMGAIIKGRDRDLGRDLAIKVLLDSHKDKPEVIQRFVEEAQIGGQLQHPGIAPIYELGQFADKRPFFAMKLVKGLTLSKLLSTRDHLDDDRGKYIGIFEQVCQTMAYAHSRGVIHRDLKPSNIMVGAFGEVQVMDWGLAKVLPSGGVADEKASHNQQQPQSIIETLRSVGSDLPRKFGSGGSETQMGSVMGTPAYMPPEQALGEIDQMDERADVFALGAILCEILTGQPPYVADDGVEVYRLASRGKLDQCLQRLDNCQADCELVDVAKHCLELEPSARPQDAGALSDRVSNYLESVEARLRETELHRAAESARATEERKRRRVSLVFATLVLLMVVLGGSGLLLLARNEAVEQKKHARDMEALASERQAARAIAERTNVELQQSLDRQRLSAAFESFYGRNTLKAQSLLDRLHPPEGSASFIAWKFLQARCRDRLGTSTPLGHQVHSQTAIDPLGQFYAATTSPHEIDLFSFEGNSLVHLSLAHEGLTFHPNSNLTISDDGRWLLAPCGRGNEEGRVLVWELTRSDEGIIANSHASTVMHESPVLSADIDDASDRIVSVDSLGNMKLWDQSTQRVLATKPADEAGEGNRRRVCFSRDGNWVFKNEYLPFGNVSIFSSDDQLSEFGTIPHGSRIEIVRTSPVGNSVAVAGYRGTEIWELVDGSPRMIHRLTWRRSGDIQFSNDGRQLAVATIDDASIEVFSCNTAKSVATYEYQDKGYLDNVKKNSMSNYHLSRLRFHERGVWCIGNDSLTRFSFTGQYTEPTQPWWYAPFASAGSMLAFPTEDREVKIVDTTNKTSWEIPLDDSTRKVAAIGLSHDARRIAIACNRRGNDKLLVLSTDQKQCLLETDRFTGCLTLRFSPVDPNFLLVSTMNKTVVMDVSNNETTEIAGGRILAAEFTNDGKRLLTGGTMFGFHPSEGMSLWRIGSDNTVSHDRALGLESNYSVATKSHKIGFAAVNGSNGEELRTWDGSTEDKISAIKLNSPRVLSIDFSPGDECLVAASPAGELAFIDASDGKVIATFRVDRPLRHVKFLEDCNRLAVSTMDGSILYWDY